MKEQLEIKYCPCCKKEIAVQKNGNPKGKQSYKCKVCGRQFSERKYPIEVRCLAVKFRDFGYSYRDIAKIFGIRKSPNTIRNWTLSKPEYDMDYQVQIKFLKEYKEICDKIEELEKCEKAIKYKQLEERQKGFYEVVSKPNLPSGDWIRTQNDIESISVEITKLGEVKYKDYSIKKIRKLQNEVNIPIEELEKIKRKKETKSVLARDTYNISEIISALERLIGND